MKYSFVFSMALVLSLGAFGVAAEEGTKPGTPAPTVTKVKAEDTRFADVEHKELVKLIEEKKVVLIDCNGSDSYKTTGHIPGAIDFQADGAELAKKLPADKAALIVSYCGSEFCPAYKQGAEAALKLGYTNVKHYPLGISGWVKAGEKTEK
jgi:rhodanese-related sulfurtransferase